MNYSHYDWDADSDLRDDVHFERASLEVEYRATGTLKLEAEMEIEHLGTGSAMEFDTMAALADSSTR